MVVALEQVLALVLVLVQKVASEMRHQTQPEAVVWETVSASPLFSVSSLLGWSVVQLQLEARVAWHGCQHLQVATMIERGSS